MNLLGKRKNISPEFEKRKIESERMRKKYPDRVPVRVLRAHHCTNIPSSTCSRTLEVFCPS